VDALVTGASGFIGAHLVRGLRDAGRTVRAYVRPGSPNAARLKDLDVELFEGDLGDERALAAAAVGVRTIFHVGAAMTGGWDDHQRTTVTATGRLADAVLSGNAERMVFVSSLTVYDTRTNVIDEDSPYKPNPREMGPYPWSKIEAEKLLFAAHRERGLAVSIVRPGIVIGPHGPVLFPHLGFRFRDRILAFGSGDNRLPLTWVGNTVDGILRAAARPEAVGQAYNLVDDGVVTVRDYVDRFASVTGERLSVVGLPFIVPYVAAAAYEAAAALRLVSEGKTSRRRMKAKHHSISFPNTKAKTELGWTPSLSLADAMERTFEWYRDRRR
jgi:nucleoside-diphosphate-sugar epimerase